MTDQVATASTECSSRRADRDLSFDFAKGILIILVIVGHLLQYVIYRDDEYWYSAYFKLIYMFHMPLFMAISGYLSSGALLRKPFARSVKDRAVQLLLPMLFWCAFTEAAKLAAFSPAPGVASGVLDFSREFAGTYWFIWATFVSFFVVGLLIVANLGSTWMISMSAVLIALAPVTFSIAPLIRYTYPFFFLGFLLARSSDWRTSALFRYKSLSLLMLSGIACACFLAWGKETYVYNNLVPIDDVQSAKQVLLMFVGSAASSAVAAEVLLRCWKFCGSSRWARFIAMDLGQSTLLLYLLQASVFRLMDLVQFGELWALPTRIAVAFVLGVTIIVVARGIRWIVHDLGFMSRIVLGVAPRSGLLKTQPASS
ncbi:nodulation factor fucose acetyltransferase NolL, partial [Bradyrhizobium sp. UFLA05-109]